MGKLNIPRTAGKHHGAEAQRGWLDDYDAAFADLTQRWESLTAPARLNALRRMVILMARALRTLLVREV